MKEKVANIKDDNFSPSLDVNGPTHFLPPATKLGQGNIFRIVCQEFCLQGPLGPDPPGTRHTPPGPDNLRPGTPPSTVHAGRYGQQVGSTHPT